MTPVDGVQVMREKLDIKILILFILRRLPSAVDAETLANLALADGTVVPAGKGIGHLPEILEDYTGRGGEVVTVEPHLRVFDGLQGLEQGSNSAKRTMPEGVYPTADAAFDAACGALRNLI